MAQQEASGEVAAAVAGPAGEQPAPQQQRSWGSVLKSFMFQMVIFYFISSYFRGKTPSEPPKGPDGEPLLSAGLNLFNKGEKLVRVRESHYIGLWRICIVIYLAVIVGFD